MPNLMSIPLAVSEELKQADTLTGRQNCALNIRFFQTKNALLLANLAAALHSGSNFEIPACKLMLQTRLHNSNSNMGITTKYFSIGCITTLLSIDYAELKGPTVVRILCSSTKQCRVPALNDNTIFKHEFVGAVTYFQILADLRKVLAHRKL